ncbi:MAG: hypothetical protein LBK72_01335, partial [Bifidobacteriaceae bacterium]|nr:hypothetical protein [Bifidobacteriaceae bacterium]
MSKKTLFAAVVALSLGLAGATTAVTAPAYAQDNDEIETTIATREALEEILTSQSAITDGIAGLIAQVASPENIEAIIQPIVEGLIPAGDAIVDLALPLVEEVIRAQLGTWGITDTAVIDFLNSIVEDVLRSDVVDSVLTSDFTQDVISRTVAYTIQDVLGQLSAETIGTVITDVAMAGAVDAIFNVTPIDVAGTPVKAPDLSAVVGSLPSALQGLVGQSWPMGRWLVKTFGATLVNEAYNYSYYNATFGPWPSHSTSTGTWIDQPTSVTVTGWNETNVKAYGLIAAVVGLAQTDPTEIITSLTEDIDIAGIVLNSLSRAVGEIVQERVDAFWLSIKQTIIDEINGVLADLDLLPSDPITVDDPWDVVGQKVLDGIAEKILREAWWLTRPHVVVYPSLSLTNPVVGDVVSVDIGEWRFGDADLAAVTYSWNGEAPTSEASYTVQASDVGQQISVTVAVPPAWGPDREQRTWSATFHTATVQARPYVETLAPVLSTGSVRVGETLSVSPGEWSPAPGAISYVWSADLDGDGAAEELGTGPELPLTAAYAGKVLKVTVTADPAGDPGYRATSKSLSAIVTRGILVPTIAPTLSTLNPIAGEVVEVLPASWPMADVDVAYAWTVGGVAVGNQPSYRATADDEGKAIQVAVTASKDGYITWTGTLTSAPVVAAEVPAVVPVVLPVLSSVAPVVGDQVEVLDGTWPAGVAVTYAWSGAGSVTDAAVYTPVEADVDRSLSVTVTASKPGHTSWVGVLRTAKVVAAPEVPTPSVVPVVLPVLSNVVPIVGDQVEVLDGTWPAGVAVSYAWSGAGSVTDAAVYAPVEADVDRSLSV